MEKPARLPAIDLLRGLVIVLMALDHTRDYFGFNLIAPEDVAHAAPSWFWTRWITHLCATVIVLLAGSSAFVRRQRHSRADMTAYLATRGALLVLLEATWISFSWQFGYQVIILQVLWALGMGMILLSLLVWLPRPAIAVVAALLLLPHNLLDAVHFDGFPWRAWHDGGYTPLGRSFGVVTVYPLMPWLGLMAAGYVLGPVFLWESGRRRRFLLAAAGVLLLAFVALRATNAYGDPQPWSPQGRGAMTDLMAFVRVTKYPPSLLYLCVTGSIGLFLLAAFERVRALPLLSLFGRHPLFFYLTHIALVHLLGFLYFQLRYGSQPVVGLGELKALPAGYVPSLAVVYAAWAGLLVLMYALTRLWAHWRGAPGTRAGAVRVQAAAASD